MDPLPTEMIHEAVRKIRRHWVAKPQVALVLGTGLGVLTDKVQVQATIPFASLPYFPPATALSHRGALICGQINNVPVVIQDGRCHLYEGYSQQEVTLPIRVLQACGASILIVSNASGGLNPQYDSGDVMVIDDHINLMGRCTACAGGMATLGRPLGPRRLYDAALAQRALQTARQHNFSAHRGVYAAVSGPNYETRAEYRFLRRIGADAVGMSTVPEAIAARHMSLSCSAISVITDECDPDNLAVADIVDILKTASVAEKDLIVLIEEVVKRLPVAGNR